jgi:eukaryotic-like serine/threonine-protein kinase
VLTAGSSVGPYELTAQLGAGGMGEVYRARDTRLNRDVAIKVLARGLSADAAALLRFEREAQALASLSHPGLVAIYDIGHQQESAYVVMELLEGETLRARLASGPLPLRKALEIGIHLAQALAAAHDRGFVHRDLKPENIFLTVDGHLKVLDFGLAQLASASAATTDTIAISTHRATDPGLIVGTVGYMAPEQARGQVVDARADIFSFGSVLYEMVSGNRAFAGNTAVDVITAALHSDPPDLSADARVPVTLARIVRRCLEKRPEDRFQSARDLAFALDGVATGSGVVPAPTNQPGKERRSPVWFATGAAVLALGVGLVVGRGSQRTLSTVSQASAIRFTVEAKRGAVPEVSVSPTGRHLAWTALADGGRSGGLFIRRLDGFQPELVPDTPTSGTPFWSPDGREVVVLSDTRLVAIDVERGGRRTLLDLESNLLPLRGGDWVGRRILVGIGNAIWLIDLGHDGQRRKITTVNAGWEEWHGFPMFLGGDTRYVYTASMKSRSMETRIASIDRDESVKVSLPENVSRVRYDPAGYLVFAQNGALIGQRVDIRTGQTLGSPLRLWAEVLQNPRSGWTAVDVSRNSVLAWRAPGVDYAQFEFVDRAGRTLQLISEADAYTNFDLSPDSTFVATTRRRGGGDLFLIDTVRNITTLISERDGATGISDPTWSPNGRQIAYRRGGVMVIRNAFGGEEHATTDWAAYPDSWSRDGKYLAVGRPQGPTYELWAIAMDGSKKEIPLVTGLALADEPRFSPDGHWVVFHAAVQAGPEIYAIPFPPTGERWQISNGGGVQPRWRADGRELYYLDPEGRVMAVAVPNGDPRRARSPEPLFNLRIEPSSAFDQFTPTADGQRFLVRRPLRPGGADTAPVHVLVNWPETLVNEPTR